LSPYQPQPRFYSYRKEKLPPEGIETYQELYEAWRRERLSKDLQPLPKDFYEKAADYTRKLRENQRMIDSKTMKARLLQQELENSIRLSSEILVSRFEKMVDSLLSNEKPIPTGFLARPEESIYQGLLQASNQSSRMKRNLSEGKRTETFSSPSEDLPQEILVRFACEIPAIVGVDLKTYGPFKPEDVASLPAENARALIHQGAAIKVEVE